MTNDRSILTCLPAACAVSPRGDPCEIVQRQRHPQALGRACAPSRTVCAAMLSAPRAGSCRLRCRRAHHLPTRRLPARYQRHADVHRQPARRPRPILDHCTNDGRPCPARIAIAPIRPHSSAAVMTLERRTTPRVVSSSERSASTRAAAARRSPPGPRRLNLTNRSPRDRYADLEPAAAAPRAPAPPVRTRRISLPPARFAPSREVRSAAPHRRRPRLRLEPTRCDGPCSSVRDH